MVTPVLHILAGRSRRPALSTGGELEWNRTERGQCQPGLGAERPASSLPYTPSPTPSHSRVLSFFHASWSHLGERSGMNHPHPLSRLGWNHHRDLKPEAKSVPSVGILFCLRCSFFSAISQGPLGGGSAVQSQPPANGSIAPKAKRMLMAMDCPEVQLKLVRSGFPGL